MYFWYKLLTYLFYPFAPFFLFLRKLKKKEHSIRYKEKLSQINTPRGEGFLIWFHVVSVGEAISILPLIENFEQDEKIKRILITSITVSSAEVLKKKFNKNTKVIHQFLPLDIPKFVKKFLKHWSPNLSIFIDSEIWPNLIFQIKERNIPLLMVNGRISKKTFSKWKSLKNFSKKISIFLFALVLLGAIVAEKDNIVLYFSQAGLITLVLNVLMMFLAYNIAKFLGSGNDQKKAITIECGLQNGTLAIVVATSVFGGGLYLIPAATYSLIMFASSLIYIFAIKKINFFKFTLKKTVIAF